MTAGWIVRRWRATALVWRRTLVALVVGLVVINATGVYARLVVAHLGEGGAAASAIEIQDGFLLRGSRERPTLLPTSTIGWGKSIRQLRKRSSFTGPPPCSRPSWLNAKPVRRAARRQRAAVAIASIITTTARGAPGDTTAMPLIEKKAAEPKFPQPKDKGISVVLQPTLYS